MTREIVQDMGQAIFVMRDAGKWLAESGKNPSKWWQLDTLREEVLLQYAKPEEFYVMLIDREPAAAIILQPSQEAQDWKSVDGDKPKQALYLHWGAVHRKFAGQDLMKAMVDHAEKVAKGNGIDLLRLDTDAERMQLRNLLERLGFELVGIADEGYRKTAFYERKIE